VFSDAIVPVERGDFIIELDRDGLRGAGLDDMQSLFSDKVCVTNSPIGFPTETNPVSISVKPKIWLDWALEHQATKVEVERVSLSN